MGCFLGCFKASKDRRRSQKSFSAYKSSHEKESCDFVRPRPSPKEVVPETDTADNSLPKLRENQDQANVRKKVTFDLNVTTFESVLVHQDSKAFREDDDAVDREVQEDKDKEEGEYERADAAKSAKSPAFPQNHRYQNYESSDDEGLEDEDGNSDEDIGTDFDEGNDIGTGDEEESYDSYFSLPMEIQRLQYQEVCSPMPTTRSATETELAIVAKGNARDRSKYIHSVLNPVENLSHWKEVKVRPGSLKNLSKENINFDNETKAFINPEPTIKSQEPHSLASSNTNPDDFANQLVVDASLSNWLVCPNNSRVEPQMSNPVLSSSPTSQDERPILGALTMEDIKQSSRTSSPRKSPSRSPEEIPIVGTVGGYWNSKFKEESASSWSSGSDKRGIPNTTSKYREDKRVSWYCTPFETRVERALEMESSSNMESTA